MLDRRISRVLQVRDGHLELLSRRAKDHVETIDLGDKEKQYVVEHPELGFERHGSKGVRFLGALGLPKAGGSSSDVIADPVTAAGPRGRAGSVSITSRASGEWPRARPEPALAEAPPYPAPGGRASTSVPVDRAVEPRRPVPGRDQVVDDQRPPGCSNRCGSAGSSPLLPWPPPSSTSGSYGPCR